MFQSFSDSRALLFIRKIVLEPVPSKSMKSKKVLYPRKFWGFPTESFIYLAFRLWGCLGWRFLLIWIKLSTCVTAKHVRESFIFSKFSAFFCYYENRNFRILWNFCYEMLLSISTSVHLHPARLHHFLGGARRKS